MAGWYESLVDMMRREGVERSGHLQINRNVMSSVSELHRALLADPRFAGYAALFYKTLPYIVELRSRAGDTGAQGEIETCFTALYGMMMMRLAGKEISPDTAQAISRISELVATLAAYYKKNEHEPLFMPSDD